MIGNAARSTVRYPSRCTLSTARQSSSTPVAKPVGRLMPATFTTASSAPNSSTSPAKRSSTASASVTEMFDARACPPASTIRCAVEPLGAPALGRAVDRDAGVDGDDEDALATELLGNRRADAERASGDDGDGHDFVVALDELPPGELTAGAPFGQEIPEAEEVAVATAVRAAARVQHAGIAFEVQPRRRAGGHERAVVAPGAEDDVGPALLGRFGHVEHLHAAGLEHPDAGGDVLGAQDHQVREVVGGDGLLTGRRHDEHVREAVRRHAVQADDAVLPLLFHRDAVAADDGVAGTPREGRQLPLEAGGEDDAVELVLGAVGDRAVRRDLRDPTGAVDQRDVGVVERGEVLVVEAGSLAPVAVVRLEHLRDRGIGDDLVDPRAMLLHHLVVELLDLSRDVPGIRSRFDHGVVEPRGVQRPPVVDEIGLDRAPDHHGAEVLHPLLLPAGPEVLGERVVGGPVAALPDRRRRALEHVHVLRRLRERRHGLDPARADADHADHLVGQLGEVRIVRRRRPCTRSPNARCGTPCPRSRPCPGSPAAS